MILDHSDINAKIIKISEKHLNTEILSICPFENITTNRVFKIITQEKSYIFKIYKSGWPEDGKLLFVDKQLTKHAIPHAKILVYSRDSSDFPNGYLIEECLSGTTADMLALSKDETIALYKKLGAFVSRIHQIKLTGYGYIGGGVAKWATFSEFMYNSFEECTANLSAHNLLDKVELETVWEEIYQRLKVCDTYPSVLCHTDLSTKNILVNSGGITLIDWDDSYSLCWIADIAYLTFWMKREYGNDAEIYRKAFLDNYSTEYDKNFFYEVEDILHVRYGLEGLNYFYDTPLCDSYKMILKEALEKSGIQIFKYLL
jgi:Ser/Thr protein kinase RdoA (MazF antagonist)